ncbi:MAG: hypothetical protein IR153_07595 [Flavobacterium sp.]|nr:hypothetical protein [Flavobacterium sp.]
MKALFPASIDKIFTKRLLVLVVLMLLMNAGVFGQTAEVKGLAISKIDDRGTSEELNMELASWLTGSRQSQLKTETAPRISTNKTSRKQFINCGMSVNRILSRTLLKKVMARDTGVV